MITIKNEKEMKEYYVEKSNTYVFKDDVEFLFNVNMEANIWALDIKAQNINAWNIKAENVKAWNITVKTIDAYNMKVSNIKAINVGAWNIEAINIYANIIVYYAVCFAYENIECIAIYGKYPNAKHFVFNGELIVKGE